MTEIKKYPPGSDLGDVGVNPYDPNLKLWKMDENGWHYQVAATQEEKDSIIQNYEEHLAGSSIGMSNRERKQRDSLLAETDYIVTKSQETNVPISTEWVNYRQALRDVPQQNGFPKNIEWPIKPQ